MGAVLAAGGLAAVVLFEFTDRCLVLPVSLGICFIRIRFHARRGY